MPSGAQGSGYAISEEEFASLLRDRTAGPRVRQLLAGWGMTVDPGDPVSLVEAHRLVQSDTARQRALYQVAMDLWR